MNSAIGHPGRAITSKVNSPAVLAADWLFVSGQGPLDLSNRTIIGKTIEEQTRVTLQHIRSLVEEAGGSLASIVKCTCYLKNLEDFEGFNGIYRQFFAGIDLLPARTTVQAHLLQDILVEIDAIAHIP